MRHQKHPRPRHNDSTGNQANGNQVSNRQFDDSGEDQDEIFEEEAEEDLGPSITPLPDVLELALSRSLMRRLFDSAREEGVSLEDFASELISEGVVLRAWEIVEKKATMRGGANQGNFQRQNNLNQQNQQGGHSNSNGHQRGFNGGNKMAQKKLQRQARQHASSMDLMADKAAFLEYVRNQEKKRSR
jgi:hypothetical protein